MCGISFLDELLYAYHAPFYTKLRHKQYTSWLRYVLFVQPVDSVDPMVMVETLQWFHNQERDYGPLLQDSTPLLNVYPGYTVVAFFRAACTCVLVAQCMIFVKSPSMSGPQKNNCQLYG